MNDGQDIPGLQLVETLQAFWKSQEVPPFVLVGVHANEKRIYEYGVAKQADYAGRGNLAGLYSSFLKLELLPHLKEQFGITVQATERVIMGLSLGGLMALDYLWNQPEDFRTVGVFSGSLWWRQRSLEDDYHDSDRIMHRQIREGVYQAGLRFWFQVGTEDETDDRDNDGIIDAIDDTLDLIAELERKGYRWGKEVLYQEIIGGTHTLPTWAEAIPDFIRWAFALKN